MEGKKIPHIHLPVELDNGYGLFLSLYKSNLKNPLRIRFSVLIEDLPMYLKEAFNKMDLKIETGPELPSENKVSAPVKNIL